MSTTAIYRFVIPKTQKLALLLRRHVEGSVYYLAVFKLGPFFQVLPAEIKTVANASGLVRILVLRGGDMGDEESVEAYSSYEMDWDPNRSEMAEVAELFEEDNLYGTPWAPVNAVIFKNGQSMFSPVTGSPVSNWE